MSVYIWSQILVEIYPCIDSRLRMVLSTRATNCSSERSFLTLRNVKTDMRSITSEDRLISLAILDIKSQLTKKNNIRLSRSN